MDSLTLPLSRWGKALNREEEGKEMEQRNVQN